jgi:hypothetical protein
MAYNPGDTNAPPYYVYVGSANLSQSAWGALEQDKKTNEATCNTKLIKLSNFECGVVIPGGLLESLLEGGTESWQSIVPYVQTGKKYDLPKDRPWNGTFYSHANLLFACREVLELGIELSGRFSRAEHPANTYANQIDRSEMGSELAGGLSRCLALKFLVVKCVGDGPSQVHPTVSRRWHVQGSSVYNTSD